MEQPKANLDAIALRLMIITSFLLGATMILLSLSVSVIRQNASASQLTQLQWVVALTVPLALIPSLIMLFTSAVILVTMDLALLAYPDKLKAISRVRTFLGATSTLILASFGSIFLVSLGFSYPWSLVFGGVGYAGAVVWLVIRTYITKSIYPTR